MVRLTRSDMEAALSFAADIGAVSPEPRRADAWVLERLSRVVNVEVASYSRIDESTKVLLNNTDYPAGPPWDPTDQERDLLMRGNPFCTYVDRTGDQYFSARRLSDVVDIRRFRTTDFFRVIRAQLPHAIQTRFPGGPRRHWSLDIARSGTNYSTRELMLIDALRPALISYESHRAIIDLLGARPPAPQALEDKALSRRENEVLDLVASGASNVHIAKALWISPATVKKHLENIYAKLEVGSRTAALAQTGRSSIPASHEYV